MMAYYKLAQREYTRWLVKNIVSLTWLKQVDTSYKYVHFFFSSQKFLKEIENRFSESLSSYTHTHESLGELEKAVETLAFRLMFP